MLPNNNDYWLNHYFMYNILIRRHIYKDSRKSTYTFFSLSGYFFFLTQWAIKIEIKVFYCLRRIMFAVYWKKSRIILGCHGSSDLATILLEVPFKTHQGQVRYLWYILTDHKKKQLPQKGFWIFLSTWGSILW